MSDFVWLSEAQMRRIEPYFPLSHGVPPVVNARHPARLVRQQRLQARPLPVAQPELTRHRHPPDQSKD